MTERKAVSFEELLGTTATPPIPAGIGDYVCRRCHESKPLTPDFWPHIGGRFHKDACRVCRDKERGEFANTLEKNRKEIAAENKAALVDTTRGKVRKLEVARALRESTTVLNAVAKPVLDKLAAILADEAHPMYVWAMTFVLERIAPAKLFAELGLAEAGLSDKEQSLAAGQRPTVSIVITTIGAPPAVDVNPIPLLPAASEGDVIDVVPVEVLQERT